MTGPRIAAFPKCYIEDIVSERMSLFEWIGCSVELEPEGLELYAGFLPDRTPATLKAVRRRAESHGLLIPIMCYSPDFTQPDPEARQREVKNQIEMIRATAELGGEGKAASLEELSCVQMPEWPPVPALGKAPVMWRRQVLFIKDDDPSSANYLLLRDTVSGGQPTIWQFFTLS